MRCQYDPTTAVGALHPLHVGLGIGQSATGESMSRGYPWTSATHTRRGDSLRTAGRGTPSLSRLTQPRSTSRWPASTSSEWPGPSRPVTRTTCCSGPTTSSPRGGVCGAGSVTSCCPPLRGSITESAPGSTTRAVPTSHVIDPTPPRRCPGLHRRKITSANARDISWGVYGPVLSATICRGIVTLFSTGPRGSAALGRVSAFGTDPRHSWRLP